MEEKRTEIGQLGEFGLIERLKERFGETKESTVKGIGDDCAVLDMGGKYMLVSTDMLVEGVHFDLSYSPLRHLGYKAVAVNVSDIAAMNGIPKHITVSIALSSRFSVEAVEEFYEGVHAACKNYNIDLVGGDTTSSQKGFIISITAIGECEKHLISYRSGAKKGDILAVTGDFGAAYLGLQTLEREKQVFLANPDMQPELKGKDYVVERQLKPEARMDIIHELRELGIVPTSMIDVSDGLASEIFHICRQSGLGAAIFEDKIPILKESYMSATDDFQISPITCALNGGEDYELLFTIKQEDFEKLKNHSDISLIGYMHDVEAGYKMRTRAGQTIDLKAQGWQHFDS